MDCFGYLFFVYGKGGGFVWNGVQEEGFQIFYVYLGIFGFYFWFVILYVIWKLFGGRFEKIKLIFIKKKKNVFGMFYNNDILLFVYFMFL